VVPCFDEERRLDVEQFRGFRLDGVHLEFLFVNDGSRDRTLEVLQRLRDSDPERFFVLDLEKNGGKAEAVRRGMLQALERHPDFVAFWDADLATPLGELPLFLDIFAARPQTEMVFAARVRLLGRKISRRAQRHYFGRVGATLISQTLGIAVYDTQCGAKMFRATDELRAVLGEPFHTAWLFDVEILARLIDRSPAGTAAVARRLYELPLDEWRDVPGSKLTRAAYTRAATSIFALYREYGAMLERQSLVK